METFESPGRVPLDPAGQIATDVLCVRCGYNLRGLRTEQGCPECSTPVGLSLREDLLRFRDPRWVARLARGAAWMLAGFGAYLVAGNVGHSFVAALGPAAGLIVLLGLVAVTFAGVWQIAAPDPGKPLSRNYTDPRWLVRALLVASVWLVASTSLIAGMSTRLMFVPGILAFLSVFGCLGELLVHLRRIARNVPAPRLARHASILLRVFAAGAGMKLVVEVARTFWPRSVAVGPGMTAAGRWIGTLRDVSNVLLLIYFLWFIVLLIGYVRVLRREARESRLNWATGSVESAGTRLAAMQHDGDINGNP